MKVLLIDNAKPHSCEFTRLLEQKLKFLCNHVICCHEIHDVLKFFIHDEDKPDLVILSGSSLNVSEPQKIFYLRKSISTLLRSKDIPVLGICFGMQLISLVYGGDVERMSSANKCETIIKVEKGSVLLNNEECNLNVTLSHQDFVASVPDDFCIFSKNKNSIQIFESLKFLCFGVQFHPEKIANNEKKCVLTNFTKFVHERCTLPPHVKISDELRINIIFTIGMKNIPYICEKFNVDVDTIMYIWRHHLGIWNLPASLI